MTPRERLLAGVGAAVLFALLALATIAGHQAGYADGLRRGLGRGFDCSTGAP